jgi:Lecithin retinol acyltransferase
MPPLVYAPAVAGLALSGGENRYRVLRNNCEHFCEWFLRGESRGYQVERFLSSRPALTMSWSIGVATLSVLVGTTICPFVSAPAAKSAYAQSRS